MSEPGGERQDSTDLHAAEAPLSSSPIIHAPGCSWETSPYCDCGEDPERQLFPSHLSPSSINSLLTCGEQFRLQRVVRVPARPMWAGVGGSVVHKLTEELDRDHFAAMKGMQGD